MIWKSGWLIIPKFGNPRFRMSKPDLKWDEVAIYIDVELPEALFVRPTLQATVVVKDEAVTPQVLTPDVVVNTAEAIERATGMKVELRVVPPPEPVVKESPPDHHSATFGLGDLPQPDLIDDAKMDEHEGPNGKED